MIYTFLLQIFSFFLFPADIARYHIRRITASQPLQRRVFISPDISRHISHFSSHAETLPASASLSDEPLRCAEVI